MSLIVCNGAQQVSRDQLAQLPPPPRTRSHRPTRYIETVDYVRNSIEALTSLEIVDEKYAINKEGGQFFGQILCKGSDDAHIGFGLRDSINKSISKVFAAGFTHLLVCANLQISGDIGTTMRKNTRNQWDDFRYIVDSRLIDAEANFRKGQEAAAMLRDKECPLDRGYEILGRAYGHGLLSPRQFTTAVGDWTTPRHEDFAPRNLWSLYNCGNEGLKRGPVGGVIGRHVSWDNFMQTVN